MAECRRCLGQGAFWGASVGKNPTDRGKNGTKRSIIVEAQGGPLGVVVAGANVHDTKPLAQTIEAIVVERPQPTPRQSQHLCLDKG
jgi:putative transposase